MVKRQVCFKRKDYIMDLKKTATKTFIYIYFVIAAIVLLVPLYWMIVSSIRPTWEIFSSPLVIPRNLTLTTYAGLLKETLFIRWFINSVIVAFLYLFLGLFFCSLAGYAFAKHNFPFKNILFWIILSSMMVPPYAIIIPLFMMFTRLGLINTYLALILPNSAHPFGIFLLRQYIHSIPTEMIESAKIDGCSEFRIYCSIILPVVKPALGALAVFLFIMNWNAFLFPLVFMRDPEMFTLQVGIASFMSEYSPNYPWMMAAAVISVIPIVIIFIRLQKLFVAGLTLGAVKK